MLIHGECLEAMDKLIERGIKVDAVICDPPYGTTACKWDSVIPFDEMWHRLKALRKERTPVVLFGSEPFSSALRMSNIKEYKYDWVWEKPKGTGHLNSKKQPMRYTENISVFYLKQSLYNAQKTTGHKPANNSGKRKKETTVYGRFNNNITGGQTTRYPKNIIEFNNVNSAHVIVHPTQKPVALMEYLIKTYTNEGDTVLDFTMGSGTTGVACENLSREFIGIEMDDKYFEIAQERINANIQ